MSAKEAGRLPLPDGFFDPPALNARETAYLVNLAKRACKELVYYSRPTGGPINWVHLSSSEGVEVFQGIDETGHENSPSLTFLRGATKIHATIDEIADFFRLDTPEKQHGFAQTVGKDLLDQKALYTLVTPDAVHPRHYVGVKWTAVESPSKLARNRDFCYLECHDEFVDVTGKRRGWARSIHSIRLPCCPRLNKSHGLVRGSLYRSGFVFIESDQPGCVDAIHTLHVDIKGNAPMWLKILIMKRRIKNIAEVNKYFQMRRLSSGKLLGDLELPTKDGVKRCEMCDLKFGLFHRKWRCRKCGQVVCTQCGHHLLLDYAGTGPRKVRICNMCSDAVFHGQSSLHLNEEGELPSKVLKCDDGHTKPIYDDAPSSGSISGSASGRRSSFEQDYYMNNEDARGIADMLEAKRMQEEFESQLRKVKRSHLDKHGVDAWRQREDFGDHDELGLPRSKSEQQRLQMEDLFRKQQAAADLVTRTSTAYLESHRGSRSRMGSWMSSDRRDSLDQIGGPPFSRLEPSSDNMKAARGRIHRDSLDSLRLSGDWPSDYVVTLQANRTPKGRHSISSTNSADYFQEAAHGNPSPHRYQRRERYDSDSVVYSSIPHARSHADIPERMRGYDAAMYRNSPLDRWVASPDLHSKQVSRQGRHSRQPISIFDDEDGHPTLQQSRGSNDYQHDRLSSQQDELAELMALSAMRLYEEEFGCDQEIDEETRRVAMQKVLQMCSSRLERQHGTLEHRSSFGSVPSRNAQVSETSRNYRATFTDGWNRNDSDFRTSSSRHAFSPKGKPLHYRDLSEVSEGSFRLMRTGSIDNPRITRRISNATLPSRTGRVRTKSGQSNPSEMASLSRCASRHTNATHDGNLSLSDVHSVHTVHSVDHLIDVHTEERRSFMQGEDMDECDAFSDLVSLPHLIKADEYFGPSATGRDTRMANGRSQEEFTRTSSSSAVEAARLGRSDSIHSLDSDCRVEWSSSFSKSPWKNNEGTQPMVDEDELQKLGLNASSSSTAIESEPSLGRSVSECLPNPMSVSELERYRASLTKMMAEYEHRESRSMIDQPEGEPDQSRVSNPPRSEASTDAHRLRKDLYI